MNQEVLTPVNAALIEKAFQHFLPDANIKVNESKAESRIESVTATIQGKLQSTVMDGILETVKVAKRAYSIYRSGTGLTIKFS